MTTTELIQLKNVSVDTNNSRAYYRNVDDIRMTTLYCMQDDAKEGVYLYKCTDEGEPEYKMDSKNYSICNSEQVNPLFLARYYVSAGHSFRLFENEQVGISATDTPVLWSVASKSLQKTGDTLDKTDCLELDAPGVEITHEAMERKTLTPIREDSGFCQLFVQDENGNKFCILDEGEGYSESYGLPRYELYTHTRDGEANTPIKCNWTLSKGMGDFPDGLTNDSTGRVGQNRETDSRHDYMLLGRYKQDLDYYFGCGGRSEKRLFFDTFHEHMVETRKLLDSMIVKPEYLTVEDLEKYQSLFDAAARTTEEKEAEVEPVPVVSQGRRR